MNEQKALPGTIRDRIQELMNRKRIKQAELAEKIGESSSTFSRFLNGVTDKISPDAIVRMAKEFEVSTDFLLGVVNDPVRKNYDIGQIGLSVDAARNLYTGKVNADVVNRLLTNPRFAETTDLIGLYLDDRLARGVAAQNELYGLAYENLRGIPDAKKDADEIRSWITNPHRDELDRIRESFEAVVRDIKKEYGSDQMKKTQVMTREITRGMFAEITKGQNLQNLRISPEEYADRICDYLAAGHGISRTLLRPFRWVMVHLIKLFGRKAAHGQPSDQ